MLQQEATVLAFQEEVLQYSPDAGTFQIYNCTLQTITITCHYDNIFTEKNPYCKAKSVILPGHSCLQAAINHTVPIGHHNKTLTKVSNNHWKIPVIPTYDRSFSKPIVNTYHNFHVRTYKAQLVGAANVIEQHLTSTPCSATIDITLRMGSCIPQENPNYIIVWQDPHHNRQEMNTLEIHDIHQQGPYILIPSLHVSGTIQDEFGPTRGIFHLHNGLVIRHMEVIKDFLQGLLDIVTKYAKTVSDDVVAPMLETHIVQTLFLQKRTMAREWERLCFLQREITQLQKWMVSVFPSTAKHFVHQRSRTQVETMGDALEVKMCKPILNYRIVTTRRIKSPCYHHFPVKLPYKNRTYFLKIYNRHLLSNSAKIKCNNRLLITYLKDSNGTYFLISANDIITPVPVLEDTTPDLPTFQTTRLHGYDSRLLTHSPDKLEPYTMLEIFLNGHNAMQELNG